MIFPNENEETKNLNSTKGGGGQVADMLEIIIKVYEQSEAKFKRTLK